MQIVDTKEVSFATASRTGYAAKLAESLKKLSPGKCLLEDVDYSEIASLDEEGLEAFAAKHKIKAKTHEDLASAISRWVASRQRTRIMASLNPDILPDFYYHTRLVAPGPSGLIEKIAIVCDPPEARPVRAPRKRKSTK